jgi:hypothetical protein
MSSPRRSSSNLSITYSSPRTSHSSLSSQSSSGRPSAYSYYRKSITGTMGSERRTEKNLRVVDPRSKNCLLIRAQDLPLTLLSAPRADTITYITCGRVSVINHEKRREDKYEPRSSDARSSDYYNSSSNRYPRK